MAKIQKKIEAAPGCRLFKDQIIFIMEHFDFGRVLSKMQQMKWKWGSGSDAYYPDQERLRRIARELLEMLVVENSTSTASGGFFAFRVKDELFLHFSVAQTSGKQDIK